MEICGNDIMKIYYELAIIATIGLLLCLLVLNPLHQKNLKKDKPPLLICMYCKGTGERVEDVNKLMFMAKVQLYFNKHMMVDKCEKCIKLPNGEYDYCDEVKEKYNSFFKDYEKEGSKFEKTMCGECMGAGQFQILSKNPKTNKWYTQENYEEDERAKTNE
jgi:hypothetical protein